MWVRGGSLGGGVSGGAAVVGGGAVGGGGRPMWIPYCSNPDQRNISAAPEFAGKTDCLKLACIVHRFWRLKSANSAALVADPQTNGGRFKTCRTMGVIGPQSAECGLQNYNLELIDLRNLINVMESSLDTKTWILDELTEKQLLAAINDDSNSCNETNESACSEAESVGEESVNTVRWRRCLCWTVTSIVLIFLGTLMGILMAFLT
ncbi:uncharacterized protein [Panulirus ornatus]|uniref:uncharacterized protein n=1 Tax=Panulirus ornatus TaxID=150431 RepID=UPI003A8C2979